MVHLWFACVCCRWMQMLKQHWLIHPRWLPKILWDLFVGVFIMYSVVVVPYRLGFNVDVSFGETLFDRVGDVLFFIDICFTFRTTFQAGVVGRGRGDRGGRDGGREVT